MSVLFLIILTLLCSRSWFPATRWVFSVGLPFGSATCETEWTLETREDQFTSQQDHGQDLHLHEVLVSGLAELDQVRFDAVHPFVDLPVVCCLFLQVFLQPTLAVNYFTYPGFQLLVVSYDSTNKRRQTVKKKKKSKHCIHNYSSLLTSGSPCRFLLSWTSRCTPCCTALAFDTAPRISLSFR